MTIVADNFIGLPVLVLLPIIGGIVCWMFGRTGEIRKQEFLCRTRSAVCILTVLAEWLITVFLIRSRGAGLQFMFPNLFGLGIGFELDGLRWILCLITTTVWFAVAVYGLDIHRSDTKKNRFDLYFLICEGATIGVFLAADLYTMLIFFEMMSMSSWVLVAHDETRDSWYAADSYLAYAVIGGLVTLMGLFLLYHLFGTVRISEIRALAAACPDRKLLYIAGALATVGFCIKSGMWPLHTWLPPSYTMAPTTATTLLSSVLSKTGVFGLAVILSQIFAGDRIVGFLVLALALITMVVGAVLGIFSTNIKRTLACSSISQIGFVLTGLATCLLLREENAFAAHGMVLHLMNHSLFKLVLFLSAGAVIMNITDGEYNAVRGFGRNKPLLIFGMLMGLWGLAGIPGGSGYISKTLLHESIVETIHLFESGGGPAFWMHVTEWVFLISGGCTFAYMTTLFVCVCVDRNEDPDVQAVYDRMKGKWCRLPSAVIIGLFALLIPVLGCAPFLMEALASFSDPFFAVSTVHPVHYLSFEILKGSMISILTGVVIYFLIVRRCLIRGGIYTDRWPASVDLEKNVYRPLLLHILPFAGSFLARSIATLPELIRIGFCRLLYSNNNNGVVIPGEDEYFSSYKTQEEADESFSTTLGTSLLLISIGMVIILVFLFLQ